MFRSSKYIRLRGEAAGIPGDRMFRDTPGHAQLWWMTLCRRRAVLWRSGRIHLCLVDICVSQLLRPLGMGRCGTHQDTPHSRWITLSGRRSKHQCTDDLIKYAPFLIVNLFKVSLPCWMSLGDMQLY